MSAAAQSVIIKKNDNGFSASGSGSGAVFDKSLIVGNNDPLTAPIHNDKFNDTRLKELEKQMEDRDWSSEDTAWERANKIGTLEAFQKYTAMYPNGAHMPEATQKVIELKVDELLKSAHEPLPGMVRIVADDDSPESTIIITNNTGYALTVLFSGEKGDDVTISPGRKASITVPNGEYRVAATVPPSGIRPFAGIAELEGGQYEVSFYVSSGPARPSNSTWLHY